LSLASVLLFVPGAAACQTLYTASQDDITLRVVDPATAATLSAIAITMDGEAISNVTGLATDPIDQQLYAVMRLVGTGGSTLAVLDPATGVATRVGDMDEKIAGIAFSCEGLYGVTGDGSDTPETLFRINKGNGALTLVAPLGRGDDGEALGFNPLDGMLYHASGHTGAYDPESGYGVIFERVDPADGTTTDIPLDPKSPLLDEEAQALTWYEAFGAFLWKQEHGPGTLYLVSTDGTAFLIGYPDHYAKGLAFVPTFRCSSDIFRDGFEDTP